MGVKLKFYRGAWWVFINHHGRRKAKRLGVDKKEALAIVKALRSKMDRGEFQLPAKDAETVKVYAERWLTQAQRTLKPSTVRFYTDNLENHIYPAIGSVPLASVSRRTVKDLLAAVSKKDIGRTTVTGIVRTLSTVLSDAVEDEKLAANPVFRPGRLKRHFRDPNALKRTPIDPFTRDEAERLVTTAAEHFPGWAMFLLCALRTGLRLGELRALRWDAIDWRGRSVHVDQNYVEKAFTSPKSGRTRRVDLSRQTRAALRLWRQRQRQAWHPAALPALVFANPAGKVWDDSKIRKAMLEIVAKAGVRRRPSPVHVLRHTFASLLIQQGESLTYVKEQMGHASIQITADTYGHLIPGGNRAAVDRLDATKRNPGATEVEQPVAVNDDKSFVISGEPGGNRTPNPQIKSRLKGSQSPEKLRLVVRKDGKP